MPIAVRHPAKEISEKAKSEHSIDQTFLGEKPWMKGTNKEMYKGVKFHFCFLTQLQRVLCVVLAASLIISLSPSAALAVDTDGSSGTTTTETIEISTAVPVPAGSESSTHYYAVGDTVSILAKDTATKSAIAADKLDYKWQSSDAKSGTYTDISGGTGSNLLISEDLLGKYIQCIVTVKGNTEGASTKTVTVRQPIAKKGSFSITKVTTDKSGELNVGDVVVASATAASGDVTNNENLTWSWKSGTSSYSCNTTIEGQTTNSLTVTADLLGKYIKATAVAGFADSSSTALGPVTQPGAVSLYSVSVSGSAKVGSTLTATAYKGNSTTKVGASDSVSYQWQSSENKSTTDSDFTDITGETNSTLTLSESLVGKYIRVKVTSTNSVVSTKKQTSYYGETSVDPLGPVTVAGQYTLSSVTTDVATTKTLNVGVVLTPKAKVQSSYTESDVPSDAKVTYKWFAKGDTDADYVEVKENVEASTSALTLTDSLVGKTLKLTASSLDNEVSWTSSYAVNAEGVYKLLRITTTPASTYQLIAGDSIKATVQAVRIDGGQSYGIDVSDKVSYEWSSADAVDGSYQAIEGLSTSEITVPSQSASKFLKVKATSGDSTVESSFSSAIISEASLSALTQKMSRNYYQPTLTYNVDTNINTVVAADIAGEKYGISGVNVKVKSVKFSTTDASATVGISTEAATNGDVTWFFIDPNLYTGWSLTSLNSASVTFEFSKGDETVEYTPKNISIPWDEQKLTDLLSEAAKDVAITYATDDSASSVSGNMTLPYRCGSKNKFAIAWSSSSESITFSGGSWSDYSAKVTRGSSDENAVLKATLSLISGADGISVEREFPITIKADATKVEQEKADLASKLQANFIYDNVLEFSSSTAADSTGLTTDLQMPRPGTIGIDGKYYSLVYSCLTSDITFNGYKGSVYQPLPGQDAKTVAVTATITSKENTEVTAAKTLEFTILPLDQKDIDSEVSLMKQTKEGYLNAILNGQDSSAVTDNLHAFQKSYLDADGKIAWSYDKATSDANTGIVVSELEGYDDMGTQGWRLFKSSNSAVVAHENLVVTKPEYTTKITINSTLSSEKYARYAALYPDNETFAQLVNQSVSGEVTVAGEKNTTDPLAGTKIKVKVKVTAVSAKDESGRYKDVVISPLTEVEVNYDDKVVAETVLLDAMTKAGCTDLVSNSFGLTTATLPDGRTLGMQGSGMVWDYWSFFINDGYASVGATQYVMNEGDLVEYRYVYGEGTKVNDFLNIVDTTTGQTTEGQTSAGTGTSTVLVNGKEYDAATTTLAAGDKISLKVSTQTSSTTSAQTTASSVNNVVLFKSASINGVELTASYNKATWTQSNTEWERRMGEKADEVAYDKIKASAQAGLTTSEYTVTGSETAFDIQVQYEECVPVYRLYNMITSEHLFTTQKSEYDNWVTTSKADGDAWVGEGVAWLSKTGGTPVYRLYNAALGAQGQNSHYYTLDANEITTLTTSHGWVQESLSTSGEVFQSGGDSAIYTCYNQALRSAHHYTSSKTEWEGLAAHGWDLESTKNNSGTGFFKCYMATK